MPSNRRAALAPSTPTPTILQEFILSFWCMPPAEETNIKRYEEIAEAGFNLVLTWFHDIPMNRRVLGWLQDDTGTDYLLVMNRSLQAPATGGLCLRTVSITVLQRTTAEILRTRRRTRKMCSALGTAPRRDHASVRGVAQYQG